MKTEYFNEELFDLIDFEYYGIIPQFMTCNCGVAVGFTTPFKRQKIIFCNKCHKKYSKKNEIKQLKNILNDIVIDYMLFN